MKLTVFDNNTLPSGGGRGGRAANISFAFKGPIRLNNAAVKLTGFVNGDMIAIGQDEDNPENWYLFKSKEGFPLRTVQDDTALQFNNAALSQTIYESFGIGKEKKSVRFLLAGQPTTVGKVTYWGILAPSL